MKPSLSRIIDYFGSFLRNRGRLGGENSVAGAQNQTSPARRRSLRLEPLEERVLLSVTTTEYDRLFHSALEAEALETPILCAAASPAVEAKTTAARVTGALEAELIAAGQNPKALTENYIFNLNSCPDSTYTIYLDFTGHTTTGTYWNNDYGSSIVTPVYDSDGDATSFSNEELLEIYEIWLRVSEDYQPFNVNVATTEQTVDALSKSGSGDTSYGIRCCIGGSSTDWYTGGGGVAYLTSFNYSTDTPCFVFSENLYSAKVYAEAVSHEVGHTLGLHHDGNPADGEYYFGADGWAPIMGAGDNEPLSQWSKGEYEGATNTEDDLNIIVSNNGFTYRTDDHGATSATATVLSLRKAGTVGSGIIERNTDEDWFKFTVAEAVGTLTIGGIDEITNLDALVELYDAGGTLVETFNPLDTTGITIDLGLLTAGTYYFSVSGTGKTDASGKVIYTDYGSLGAYTVLFSPVPLTVVVTTELDSVDAADGVLSLREALSLAADNGTVEFASSLAGKTISLTGGELAITRSVTIDASALYDAAHGIPGMTIDANGSSRVLTMDSAAFPRLSLLGLTITGGNSSEVGGGIYAAGTLSLERCVVTGNMSGGVGGGIGSDTGGSVMTLSECVVTLNEGSDGGGIYCNWSCGVVTLTDSLLNIHLIPTRSAIMPSHAPSPSLRQQIWVWRRASLTPVRNNGWTF